MTKLTFEQAMELIQEERSIDRNDVRADALRRKVWLFMYSAPGCMPDNRAYFSKRADALEYARSVYADDAPRGFMTELRRNGIAATDKQGYYRVEITRVTLADLF